MTTPERSVEEIVEETPKHYASSPTLPKQIVITLNDFRQAIQTERQKREEMVGEVRLLLAKHYRGEDFDDVGFLEDLRKITQPNNPK